MNGLGRHVLTVAAACALLAGCSGGGGGTSSAPPPPPVSSAPPPPPVGTEPVWVPGSYAAASTFKDRCERPRSGVDIEGNAFPDRAGSTTIENFWLRSWTEETYLWNEEVPDLDPARFDDRLAYFAEMRTDMVTPSGTPKDDFHFSQPTEDFLQQRNSAPTASYGVSFAFVSNSPPRELRVRYTDPGTPAAEVTDGVVAFPRGARILEADGVDLVYADSDAEIDVLNAALFPATAGEAHDFLIEEADGGRRSVTLISEALARKPVNLVRVLDRGDGKVGYLLLNTFGSFSTEAELIDAFETLRTEGVTDLVLDLRYNGGGLLAIASQLATMIAGPDMTRGQDFERLRFNAAAGRFNPVTGRVNDPTPFYDTTLGFSSPEGTRLPSLDLDRVFILSTGDTCSASEAVLNGLRGIDFEVVLIGDRTCGKPYGFYPTDNCGETYYTIQFQGVNDKGFGDYADGFVPIDASAPFGEQVPGCRVADDMSAALGDEGEGLLAAALGYRETGRCPSVDPVAKQLSPASAKRQASVQTDQGAGLRAPRSLADSNRDMRMPGDGGR